MATLDQLRKLGYQVDVAFGDAQIERDRRDQLEKNGEARKLEKTADELVRDAAAHLRATGHPDEEIIEISSRLAVAALEELKTANATELEQADRAIAEAETMPTVYRISGYGIDLMVRDDDSETIDALADRKAHAERVKQHSATDG